MNTRLQSLLFLVVATSSSRGAEEPVPLFGRFETSFDAAGDFTNPYTDLSAEAALTGPDGLTRRVPLFWDGGRTWRLRFSPDQIGPWTWRVQSPDRGLDGQAGRFTVVASERPGSIRPMREHPHHFERQAGGPFWFLGDTAWALFTDSEDERHRRDDALRYVDARAAQGFNVLHSMLLSEAGWGNNGGPPFHDIAAQQLNPDYWREVDLRLAHANAQGLVCGLALAWGDKGRGERYCWGRFPDLAARECYARYVAARYSAFDVYFLVSGEWHGEVRSRRSDEAAVKQEFIAIGQALRAADPHQRMVAIHPMTRHGSVREFVGADWMSFGDYQQNYRELHQRVLDSRETGRPVVNSEYGYLLRDQSGDGVPDKDNSTSVDAMRHATWDVVMAGGYVVTGFGTTYFGGNRDPGPFNLDAAKNDDWESQLAALQGFFTGLNWWRLQPHDDVLRCQTRGADSRELSHIAPPAATYWCLAEPGKTYVVYARGIDEIDVVLSDGEYMTVWFNPRTGETKSPDAADSNHSHFRLPDRRDWVLLLRRAAP